jgi:hypothetical protein
MRASHIAPRVYRFGQIADSVRIPISIGEAGARFKLPVKAGIRNLFAGKAEFRQKTFSRKGKSTFPLQGENGFSWEKQS